MSLTAGERLGPYEITGELGAGGMGVVYRADDTKLRRTVALKFLPREWSQDDTAKERFVREAQAASAIDHPNICTVHAIESTDDGQLFIVMAYYAGQTLKERLAQGALPLADALDVARQIAAGLAKAHDLGIVHRDIKPANVQITTDGLVKILDFGLAKLANEQSLTQTGTILGTIAYMSPEQSLGGEADRRSDVWSLGAVLYEMLTGHVPFRTDHAEATIHAIRFEDPPPLTAGGRQIPPGVAQVVATALSKHPVDRYEHAGALSRDLRRLLERSHTSDSRSTPTVVMPEPTRWSRRRLMRSAAWVGAIAAVAALAGPPAVRWLRVPPAAPSLTAPAQRYLAVLPATLADQDVESRIFGRGLAVTLTERLSSLSSSHGLQVASADSVSTLEEVSAESVGRELGLGLVLLCTVQRDFAGLRVTVTLVDGASGLAIDSETATGNLGDSFALQDEIVAAVTRMLAVELPPAESAVMRAYGTEDPRAYFLYLQGQGYLYRNDRAEDVDSSISVFQQALDADPEYTLATAGLGNAYWEKYRKTSDAEWPIAAERSCEQAIVLDNDHPAGHVCLGTVYGGTGRHDEAVREFERPIEIDATNHDALRGLAVVYEETGQLEDAEATYRRAIDVRPHHWAGYSWLGVFYLTHSRFREAVEAFEQVIELTPDSFLAYSNLGVAHAYMENWAAARVAFERSLAIKPTLGGYSNLGTLYFFEEALYFRAAAMYSEALKLDEGNYLIWGNLGDARYWGSQRDQADAAYLRALELAEQRRETTPDDPGLLASMGGYRTMLGDEVEAVALISRSLELAPDDPELRLRAAQVYVQLGRPAEALQQLTAGVRSGLSLALVTRNPWFNLLRADPSFQALATEP